MISLTRLTHLLFVGAIATTASTEVFAKQPGLQRNLGGPSPAPAPTNATAPAPAPTNATAPAPAPAPASAAAAPPTTPTPFKTPYFFEVGNASVAPENYALVWSDEFNGEELNSTIWNRVIENWGGGNNELQAYTDSSDNIAVTDGSLMLTARNEKSNDRLFSSGKISSKGKFAVTHGFVVIRMKANKGEGVWPAIWMLPENNTVTWPTSGEIDIVELLGNDPKTTHAAIHYGEGDQYHKSANARLSFPNDKYMDEWHTYGLEWSSKGFTWWVDGYNVTTVEKATADMNCGSGKTCVWPFEQKFHFIMNVAVGGGFGGMVTGTTNFPRTMEVDYIRVYQQKLRTMDTGDYFGPGLNLPIVRTCDGMAYSAGVAYNGEVVAQDVELTQESCCELCRSSISCNAFSWYTNGTCNLLSSTSNREEMKLGVRGFSGSFVSRFAI